MTYQNIAQPVPFFDSPSQRQWEKDRCRGQVVDGPYFLNTHGPTFVIERDESTNLTFTWKFVSEDGTDYAMADAGFVVVNTGGRDFIFQSAPGLSVSPALPCGRYCIEVSDGTKTYYSEWFILTSAECYAKMTKIAWGDLCAKAGMPWNLIQSGVSIPYFFIFGIDVELGPIVTVTDEEVEDDGTQERVVSMRTTSNTSVSDVLPEHLVRCFHAMKHHDTVRTVLDPSIPSGARILRVGNITSSPVASGCRQNVTVQLQIQKEWRGDCCGQAVPGCPPSCGTFNGVFGIDELVLGNTYLYDGGTTATYYGLEQEEEHVDDNGMGSITPCGRVAMTENPSYTWMRYNGITWVRISEITEVSGTCEETTIKATIPATFTGIIEGSITGVSWTEISEAYSKEDLEAGVSIIPPANTMYFRVKVVGDQDCVSGYSPLMPSLCCPVFVITSNLLALCGDLPQNTTALIQPFPYVGGSILEMVASGETLIGEYRIDGGAWVPMTVQTTGTSYAITDIPYTTAGQELEVRVKPEQRTSCDWTVSDVFECPE